MPKRIVVGVDGSPDAGRALEWAAQEARLRHADLEVVHVRFARAELLASYPNLAAGESKVLSAAVESARRLAPGVRVSGRLLGPPVGEALVRASEGAALLVVGTRGLSLWRRADRGSVSGYCSHYSSCPVVVVRQSTEASAGAAEDPAALPAG